MNNIVRTTLAVLTIAVGGFSVTAQAESNYPYFVPETFSHNVAGGGRVVVTNTGDSSNPVQVEYDHSVGAQQLPRGQAAMITGGKDEYHITVGPVASPPAGNPLTLLGSLFSGRSRG